jgi:Protein of unknown function (DUF3326)
LGHEHPARSRSILDFRPRTHESCECFTTVLVVPTGIDAKIGGHAGDAGPVARLLAATSDRLITHPNVVNGADINEMPENGLYVEGSVLTRLMMGTAGLAPVRANRVLPLIQEHPEAVIWHTLVNAVSAAYGAGGFPCLPVVPLPIDLVMTPDVSAASGRATGVIEGFDVLCEVIERRLGTFEAIAMSSIVGVPEEVQRAYFIENKGINPFGGIEALLTHALRVLAAWIKALVVDLRDLRVDAQTGAHVGEVAAETDTLRQRVEGDGVAIPGKLRAIPIPQPRGGHMHLDLRPHDMAYQQRLEKRACREAGQRRNHKAQDVGKCECLQRVERTAACHLAQPRQLIPVRRDGSRPHDERRRLDVIAWKCTLPPHGVTSAPDLPAPGMCDWNLSRKGGL